MGAATSTLGDTAGATLGGSTNALGSAAVNTVGATLNWTSRGVVVLQGLAITSAADNATQGSLVTSRSQNVRLDSGTQMLLRVTNQ